MAGVSQHKPVKLWTARNCNASCSLSPVHFCRRCGSERTLSLFFHMAMGRCCQDRALLLPVSAGHCLLHMFPCILLFCWLKAVQTRRMRQGFCLKQGVQGGGGGGRVLSAAHSKHACVRSVQWRRKTLLQLQGRCRAAARLLKVAWVGSAVRRSHPLRLQKP